MVLQLNKKCEMCGAQLEIAGDGMTAACGYCGGRYSYTRPVTEKSATAISRADGYRQRNLFDNAIVEYTALLKDPEYAENAEVYWGLMLSEYGIEYVHDKHDDIYVPTCHRTVKTPVFDNANYKNALKFASSEMREIYEARGAEISAIQTGIWAQAQAADDYDVFLCFKSTDKRAATEDRYIARRIFDELTKRGFKTFFSEVTLKNKLGVDYEPIIYKALSTARVMLLVATDEEYINAPFVRNEWSRFKDRMKETRGLSLIPVFKNLSHAALPTKEQGVDLDKYPAGGYEIDIADNLESLLGKRAIPKVDKEILEEYAQYNEINKSKFERAYQKALREVDLSPKRTRNAGKEFAAKAEEMRELGDYRNAEILAREYTEKAELYSMKENTQKKKRVAFDIAKIILSIIVGVVAIIGLVAMAGGMWGNSLQQFSTMSFILLNIFTAVSAGSMLIICVVYVFFHIYDIKLKRNSNSGRKFLAALDKVIVVVNLLLYLYILVANISVGAGGSYIAVYFFECLFVVIIFICCLMQKHSALK